MVVVVVGGGLWVGGSSRWWGDQATGGVGYCLDVREEASGPTLHLCGASVACIRRTVAVLYVARGNVCKALCAMRCVRCWRRILYYTQRTTFPYLRSMH